MNRMNSPFKTIRLATLLLMLGSGLASAAEPMATPQDGTVVVQTTQASEAQSAANTEIIHLAWDRVGIVA